jgi:pimeloyl-ACP methyl ester carboxylesterase
MEGARSVVCSPDGVSIGLVTAGVGSPLLLVHGGMSAASSWAPLWEDLASRWTVTAMDRRGRGTSGDGAGYSLAREADDIIAVSTALTDHEPRALGVFAYSYGATCALAAVAGGAPVARLALYEPPGPATVSPAWIARVGALIAAGQPGRAVADFLTHIIGLGDAEIQALRDAPGAVDVLAIAAETMQREAEAIRQADLPAAASRVTIPVALLLGERSPAWAQDITRELNETLAAARVFTLVGQGHQAIGSAPAAVLRVVESFLAAR